MSARYMIRVKCLRGNGSKVVYWYGDDYEDGPIAKDMKVPYDYYVFDSGFISKADAEKVLKENIPAQLKDDFEGYEIIEVVIVQLDPYSCPEDDDEEENYDLYYDWSVDE